MDVIRDDAIGGFNTFLADQQRLPGETLTLVCSTMATESSPEHPLGKVKPHERGLRAWRYDRWTQ
jgi:hypothetical protein